MALSQTTRWVILTTLHCCRHFFTCGVWNLTSYNTGLSFLLCVQEGPQHFGCVIINAGRCYSSRCTTLLWTLPGTRARSSSRLTWKREKCSPKWSSIERSKALMPWRWRPEMEHPQPDPTATINPIPVSLPFVILYSSIRLGDRGFLVQRYLEYSVFTGNPIPSLWPKKFYVMSRMQSSSWINQGLKKPDSI